MARHCRLCSSAPPRMEAALAAVVCVLCCLLLPGTAWAGHYEVEYSGGTATDETGSYPYQTLSIGYWGRSAGYVSGSARANARASCSGQITATFTWKPDYTGEPPPDKAVVYEESTATTQGSGSGTANNGLNGTSGLAKRYRTIPATLFRSPVRLPPQWGRSPMVSRLPV